MTAKQRAAEAALDEIRDGMIVGLGTGSTAEFFLTALGEAIARGKFRNLRGVPTSKRSEARAKELKIPLIELDANVKIDVTIDGADEVAPNRDLIKGLGGALLREKIVAQNSKRVVIIADEAKLVSALGETCPLPVEVTSFAHESHASFLKSLNCTPKLRHDPAANPFVSDNGNYVYDCKFARIADPRSLQEKLRERAGVVESGLFLAIASTVIVGFEDHVENR